MQQIVNSGQRANRTGKHLEAFVAELLDDYGYEEVEKGLFFSLIAQQLQQPIFAYQCIAGKTIFGGNRHVDFIVYHPTKHPDCLVIQCKWQARSGSVDQKYPYDVECIKINPQPSIIILDGGGYSAGAERWLKAQAGDNNLLHVFNQGEFARFASKGNL